MFNKTNYHKHITNSISPSTIEVKEFKAPTDESIKFYKETYNKVVENIIKDQPLEVNNIKAHSVIIPPMVSRNYEIHTLLNINGVDYKFYSQNHVNNIPKEFPIPTTYLTILQDRDVIWYALQKAVVDMYTNITKDTSKLEEFNKIHKI